MIGKIEETSRVRSSTDVFSKIFLDSFRQDVEGMGFLDDEINKVIVRNGDSLLLEISTY
jgi:hypothetical protein